MVEKIINCIMKVNLNNIVLSLLLIIAVLLYFNKRRELKDLKMYCSSKAEYYESKLSDVVRYHTKKEKLLRDSLSFYKNKIPILLESNKRKVTNLKNKQKELKDSIINLSIGESIKYLDSNFVPIGEDEVLVHESQVKEIHASDIECKEVKFINDFQQDIIHELDKAYSNCSKYNEVLENNLEKSEGAQKALKRKKNNRTIYGIVVTSLLVLVVI
jgi:hypothetical protein